MCLQRILLHCATGTQKKICVVYGKGAVTDWICQNWFVKFHTEDFSLDDVPQSGRPVEVDSNQIETLTENNQHYIIREIADILKISKSSVENHLHQLMLISLMFGPHIHKVKKEKLLDHISEGSYLLNHHQPHQMPVFIQRRWCCVYGGICRESSIIAFFWKTKRFIPTSTVPS